MYEATTCTTLKSVLDNLQYKMFTTVYTEKSLIKRNRSQWIEGCMHFVIRPETVKFKIISGRTRR